MIATPNAVILAGAEPVLVDIDPKTLCLDAGLLEKAITPKTKAVFHVSMNGRSGDLNELKTLCDKKGLALLEDAAQSLGSFNKGRHLGTIGAIGSFSFSVPKIITTGQGGAVVTNDQSLHEKMLKLKDFGRLKGGADIHDEIGWNFKFTDLQAVFGIEQMKKLKSRTEKKKLIWRTYRKMLDGVGDIEFVETDLDEVTPWFVDVFVDDPEGLRAYLKERGIGARPVYPPLHSQKVFSHIKGDFKNADYVCGRGLWLPSSVFLEEPDIARVSGEIKRFFKH